MERLLISCELLRLNGFPTKSLRATNVVLSQDGKLILSDVAVEVWKYYSNFMPGIENIGVE